MNCVLRAELTFPRHVEFLMADGDRVTLNCAFRAELTFPRHVEFLMPDGELTQL